MSGLSSVRHPGEEGALKGNSLWAEQARAHSRGHSSVEEGCFRPSEAGLFQAVFSTTKWSNPIESKHTFPLHTTTPLASLYPGGLRQERCMIKFLQAKQCTLHVKQKVAAGFPLSFIVSTWF